MKKLMLSLAATGLMAGAVFAAAELNDENQAALTEALLAEGYTVVEITLDDAGNYLVTATMEDANYVLTVSETFEVIETQPAG